jgi:hypothetical protein
MADAPDLLLARTTLWRRRVPLWVLRLAVAVPLALLHVLEFAAMDPCTVADPCRSDFTLTDYWLGSLVVPWGLAGIPLAFLAPRVAVWPAAVVAAATAVVPASGSAVRPAWALAAVAWVALGSAEVLLRWRQAVLAQGWGAVRVSLPRPEGGLSRLPRDADARRGAVAVLALMSAVTLGLLFWHAHDLADVRAFEARAERVDARVVGIEDDGYTSRLDVAGRRVSVETLETYRVGDVVPVLVDPTRRDDVALVAEPRDPSWSLGLAAFVLLAGSTVALRLWARGAARVRLVADGGPAVRVRLGRRGSRLVIGAVDDLSLSRPLGQLSDNLDPLSDLLTPYDGDDDYGHDDGDDYGDDGTGRRSEPGLADVMDTPRPSSEGAGLEGSASEGSASEGSLLARLPDAELVAWAEGDLDFDELTGRLDRPSDEDEDEEDGPYGFPGSLHFAVDGGTEVTVVGLSRDGAPLAVLDEHGEAWLTGALHDPWRPGDLADLAVDVVRARPPAPDRHAVVDALGQTWRRGAPSVSGRPEERSVRERVTDLVGAFAERYGMPLAYMLAVLAYPVARWLYGSDPSTWSLLHTLWVLLGPAEGLIALAGLGKAALAPHRAGVLHRGFFVDRVIAASRVVSVLAGPTTLVFRLADPDDALSVPAVALVPYRQAYTAKAPSPGLARETVEQWLAAAHAPAPRWTARPTAALGPSVVLLLAVVAAWAAPRLSG